MNKMIESRFSSQFENNQLAMFNSNLPVTFSKPRTDHPLMASTNDCHETLPAAYHVCRSNQPFANGFYDPNIRPDQSDPADVVSPDRFHFNPNLPQRAPGFVTPYSANTVDSASNISSMSPVCEMKPESCDMWGYARPSPLPHESAFSSQFPYNRYCGIDFDESVRRKNATRESTNTLKSWLQEHKKNPYPTKGEKIMLAIITKMTLTQVSTWFANARRRLKKENKMTWVPKNRSSDASNGGGSKKNNGNTADDDDSNNDDVQISPSKNPDERTPSSPNKNLSKEMSMEDAQKESTNAFFSNDEKSTLSDSSFSVIDDLPPVDEESASNGYAMTISKPAKADPANSNGCISTFNRSSEFYIKSDSSLSSSNNCSLRPPSNTNHFAATSPTGYQHHQSSEDKVTTNSNNSGSMDTQNAMKPCKLSQYRNEFSSSTNRPFCATYPQNSVSNHCFQSTAKSYYDSRQNSCPGFDELTHRSNGNNGFYSGNSKNILRDKKQEIPSYHFNRKYSCFTDNQALPKNSDIHEECVMDLHQDQQILQQYF